MSILDYLPPQAPPTAFEPLFDKGMFVEIFTESHTYMGRVWSDKNSDRKEEQPIWMPDFADHRYYIECFDGMWRFFWGNEMAQRKNSRSVTYAMMKALSINGGKS